MTTIILICIGVILAASAALMTVYYGGDVLGGGEVKAQATTLENAAQNIHAAMTGRRFNGDRSLPTTLDQLKSGNGQTRWLAELPDISQAEAGPQMLMDDAGFRLYAVPGVKRDVCLRVNQDYGGDHAVIPVGRGNAPRGCFVDAGGVHVFYSVLGRI